MRAAPLAAVLVALLPALAAATPRPWAGPALALDPVFAAGAAGCDWFFSPRAAIGVAVAATLPAAGDETATESGYAFFSALTRLRAPAPLPLEVLAGAGLARIRFGTPGAHTELAPDVVLGAAIALPLARRLELAAELATHVTFSATTAARNPLHTSEVLVVALRWGP